jgi:glycosyltransferase involved in cell wall biosynthesis
MPTSNLSDRERSQSQDIVKIIKTLFITQYFPPDYAPTGQLIDELVKVLSEKGLKIRVFSGQPGYAFQVAQAPRREMVEQVEVRRTRTAQFWPRRIRGKAMNGVMFFWRAMVHLLRHWRHQDLVVVTTAPPFLPLLAYIAHIWFRLPYVCILYDLYPEIAMNLGVVSKHHWLTRLWQGINRQIWRKAGGIVVLSSAMKQQVAASCPGIADKIAVIHNWGNPDWIEPMPKADNWFAGKYDLVKPFTVLYSGNMGRCHDLKTIVEAASYLRGKPIQFLLIGDGAQKEALEAEVERLGLDNVRFLPYQDKEVLPYSLTACDLSLISIAPAMEALVAPSKLYPILAAGRAVVAVCPATSFLTQLIAEAECGKSFENGDCQGLAEFIDWLRCHPEAAEGLGKAGRDYLRSHFTLEIAAQKYFEVLQRAACR